MVLLPFTRQVGGVDAMVGAAGVANCAAMLNDALAAEKQPPPSAITV